MKLEGIDVDWAEEFNGAVTVCDLNGIIVYMNEYSIQQFKKYGGAELLGGNLLDCHPEPSKTKLAKMLEEPIDNMYIVEKEGSQKIIYQTPWREKGVFKGVIEITFKLIADLDFLKRK